MTVNPPVKQGKPYGRGTRITVSMIIGALATGRSPDEILNDYSGLETDDIRQSTDYARVLRGGYCESAGN